jgi:putative hydrolase of the HAD superfamily
MEPAPPPELPPALEALAAGGPARPADAGPRIRAVLFDVYGTLFTSAAGDIGAAISAGAETAGADGVSTGESRKKLDALAAEYGVPGGGETLTAYFRSAVEMIHREAEVPYPEVRVEEIWSAFLRSPDNARQGRPRDPLRHMGTEPGKASPAGEDLALRYELSVNPVYPMPGALDTLGKLGAAGYTLGIISNAQFFTPLLFDAFFGASPENLGFDPELLIYSFKEGCAKPSPALFNKALSRLAALGVESGACLYVGNDMRNDIRGAASAGFKTLLFAGDGRSLRLRDAADNSPWGIIRRLRDIIFFLDPPNLM